MTVYWVALGARDDDDVRGVRRAPLPEKSALCARSPALGPLPYILCRDHGDAQWLAALRNVSQRDIS
jgi:hypothetical protein